MDTASPPEPETKIPAPKRKLRNQVQTKPEPVNRPASRAISRPTGWFSSDVMFSNDFEGIFW